MNFTFIKNDTRVLCKNCKYYIPPTKHTVGKCSIFGEKNLETGETEYLDAVKCRTDFVVGNNIPFERTCGTDGIYYGINLKK